MAMNIPLLRNTLSACPDLVKPNKDELENYLGYTLDNTDDCIAACYSLVNQGVGAVCLSLGREGALFVNKDGVWSSFTSIQSLNPLILLNLNLIPCPFLS
jgi:tagatose 6-phosphate kinase